MSTADGRDRSSDESGDGSGGDPDLEPDDAVPFVRTVIQGIQQQNVSFMAASIAYQAFVSLIPLLVLVFFLVTTVGDEQLATRVTEATEGFLPQSGQELLFDTIEGSVSSAGASIIGLVTLLWGALKIFRGLDTAFSEIYGTTGENTLLVQVRDGLIVFGAIVAALIAAGAGTIAFAVLPEIPFIGLLNPLLLVTVLTVAFYPMYYFFPNTDVSPREVLPGAVFAAVGWAALQGLFQVYVALAGSGGGEALGAILLLLTWLYFGGLVLLIGAVVNASSGGKLDATGEVAIDAAAAGEPDGTTGGGATGSTTGGGATGSTTSAADRGENAQPDRADDLGDAVAAGRATRDVERLEARIERLERERDQLRNDLAAQRARRYTLEDETDELARDLARVERENERLRRQMERRMEPAWRRTIRRLADRFDAVRVGVVRSGRRR